MTRQWTYYLSSPADAAAADPACTVFSATWKPGLDKDATFVVVAAPSDAPVPGGKPLASVELEAGKNPWPPPPPPPPGASVQDFGAATTALMLSAGPRSID